MRGKEIYTAAQLMEYIQQIGFLPLLDSGIYGYSAEDIVADDCRYILLPDGGWDWPLWKWKGPIVTEGNCVYGKFFAGKAGFISKQWWGDFCNYRRSTHPVPQEGTIEDAILMTLREHRRCVAESTTVLPDCRWDAILAQRISSIQETSITGNMAGDGHY